MSELENITKSSHFTRGPVTGDDCELEHLIFFVARRNSKVPEARPQQSQFFRAAIFELITNYDNYSAGYVL